MAHALARLTLSRYAPVPPEAWSFSLGEHGRPEIEGPSDAGRLRFNLSHTRGMVACAVVRELDIGVDVGVWSADSGTGTSPSDSSERPR